MSTSDLLSIPLGAITLFGGLVVWPIARRRVPPGSRRANLLHTVFRWHLAALVTLLLLIAFQAWSGSSEWYVMLVFPYLVGVLSPIASGVVVLATRKEKKDSPE